MRKVLVGALIAALPAIALGAKQFDTSINAFQMMDAPGGGGIAGPAIYSTGFEAPFLPGPVEPQQGWTATHVNDAWASIATPNPNGGVQHLRTKRFGATPGGGNRVALNPTAGPQPLGNSSMSVDVFIDATGGADYDVVPQAPSQGFLTSRVKFFYGDYDGDLVPGDILVLDDFDGPGPGGLAFIGTGVEYTVGAYKNLRIDVTAGDGTVGQGAVQVYYDNALIYTNAFGIIAGNAIEQFAMVSDNFQNNDIEHADFDNLAITPEPASLLALGLGLAFAARRRR